MSQTKIVALLAGAALSLGTAVAQTSIDRAADAERQNTAAARSNLQGGGDAATLKVGGLIQFQYHADWRSDDGGVTITKDDDFTHGFQNNKTKLWVKGNAAENLEYAVQGDFSSSGGDFVLDDAWFKYSFNNNFAIKGGQFKLPALREESIADQYQLSAARSTTNAVFTQTRSQGIQAEFTWDTVRAMVAFSDGFRTKNTDFNSSSESDWALTGRVDVRIDGDWKRFDDFTSFKGESYACMIGGAIHFQGGNNTGDGADAAANTSSANFILYTVDAQVEGDGWNVFGAFIGSNTDPETAGDDSTSAYGVVVQGGVFVDPSWELFARWDAIFADKNADGATNLDPKSFHFITAGVNYYLVPKKHTMKFTAGAVVALNETYALLSTNPLGGTGGTDPFTFSSPLSPAGGILGDIDSGELSLFAQVQVLF